MPRRNRTNRNPQRVKVYSVQVARILADLAAQVADDTHAAILYMSADR